MSRRSARKARVAESRSSVAPVQQAPRRSRGLWQAGNGAISQVIGQMQHAFGEDFSGVQVERGTQAASSAEALGAVAYTRGEQIVLGADAPSPESPAGQ